MKGDQTTLTLYVSQAPQYSKIDAETPNNVFSDLRTITYTCQPSVGLIRSETINVLGNTGMADIEDVLASEVIEMYFRYFDPVNQSWTTEWDGTTNGAPAAIEVTLTVQMADIPGVPTRPPVNHRLVIAIPAFGSPIAPSTTSGGTAPNDAASTPTQARSGAHHSNGGDRRSVTHCLPVPEPDECREQCLRRQWSAGPVAGAR